MLLFLLYGGSEPFCNFRLRSPKSSPFRPLPPSLHFRHSCLLHLPLLVVTFAKTGPFTVKAEPCRVMLVSPLCLSLVLILYCTLSVLACCTSVWSPGTIFCCCCCWFFILIIIFFNMKKKHVKNGFVKTKVSWEEGYTGSRAVGLFPDQIAWSRLSQFLL